MCIFEKREPYLGLTGKSGESAAVWAAGPSQVSAGRQEGKKSQDNPLSQILWL